MDNSKFTAGGPPGAMDVVARSVRSRGAAPIVVQASAAPPVAATLTPKISELPVAPEPVDRCQVTAAAPQAGVLKIKGAKDTTAKVLAKLKRSRPRTDTNGQTDFSRSSERIIAGVKYVVTTGLPPLDEATGGIPFGKVTEIFGLDSCGKTALTMLICGRAKFGNIYEYVDGRFKPVEQPYEVTVVYLDNENSLEEGERMKVQGKEVDCILAECDTIDQIFKTLETAAEAIAEVEKQTGTLQFLVVAVDTIAGTSTQSELQGEWGKQDYRRQPAQLREGFRNTIRRLKDVNVAMVCSNQVGDSFKPKAPGQRTVVSSITQEEDISSFGGKALKYYAHLRLFVVKTPAPYKLSKTHRFPDGFQVHFKTSKNRHRMPLRQGRLVLLFQNAACEPVDPADYDHLSDEEFKVKYPGGYSAVYSILEHLAYMKFITYGATGGYRFNFGKYGIKVAGQETPSLQDADDHEVQYLDVENREAWPAFYRAHKAEVDELFAKSVTEMFIQKPASLEAEDDSTELDGISEVVPEE